MKIALIVLAVLLAVVVVLLIVGLFVPRSHVASRSALFAASPQRVWAVLVDTGKAPEWRTGLDSVEALPPLDGKRRYREVSGFGAVTYVVEEERAPERLVGRIADEGLGFGGSWTWELKREGEGTRVTITERGFITNPLFRVLARFVFGYEKTMETCLRDLGRRLGPRSPP
ncbi:MAG: SRPBCC family protein [Planctomycetes bacterium]|nr:SRPBCC family protein [Planctomycetota bacterium]